MFQKNQALYQTQNYNGETLLTKTTCTIKITPAIYQSDKARTITALGRDIEIHPVLAHPRVEIVKDLVTSVEAKRIIEVLDSYFERSTVGYDSLHSEISEVRTSSTCFIRRRESLIIEAIERRISAVTGLPIENIEPLQLIRYKSGQQFKAHYDFLGEQNNLENICGDRKYTCLIYLNNLAEEDLGGATKFHCVGLEVKPSRGDAIFWENLDNNGCPNYQTLHSGEPPQISVKYVMTAWIREGAYPV